MYYMRTSTSSRRSPTCRSRRMRTRPAMAWWRSARTRVAVAMRDKSLISDLFQGQLVAKKTCKVCARSSVKFEPFTSLSLPVLSRLFLVPALQVRVDGVGATSRFVVLFSTHSRSTRTATPRLLSESRRLG